MSPIRLGFEVQSNGKIVKYPFYPYKNFKITNVS